MKRLALLFVAPAVLASVRVQAESIELSLADAVARALSEGTAARIAAERVEGAKALAEISRSALLPTLQTSLAGSDQILNLKTFGFTPPGFPGGACKRRGGPRRLLLLHRVTSAARLAPRAPGRPAGATRGTAAGTERAAAASHVADVDAGSGRRDGNRCRRDDRLPRALAWLAGPAEESA